LFDYDGVLVNSMPYHVQAWQEVMARHGVEIDPIEIYLNEGATTMEVAAELFHRHRKPASPELVQQIVNEKRDAYLARNATTLNEGVTEFIEYLREQRYRLGIVTGSIRAQVEAVLGPLDLQWFDCLIAAEDVDYGKPDPEPYIRGSQKLGCAPSECLVIENAPLGIISAKSAGMSVVAITTTLAPYHLRLAEAVVSDFWELRRRFPAIVSSAENPALQLRPKPKEKDYSPMTDVDFEEDEAF
jgi:HAD superfamily hydrolase (TIGR01509 family)